jgi:hypothetical protein
MYVEKTGRHQQKGVMENASFLYDIFVIGDLFFSKQL